MDTTKLGEDIFAAIIPHLSPADALIFGATCSFLRTIAVRHAVRDVLFDSIKRLTKFSTFMLATPSRLVHLRRLTLGAGIVGFPITIFSAVDPIDQLVAQASKLEHLSVRCTELFVSFLTPLRDAIASHAPITSLELSSVGVITQGMILNLRCAPTLQELVLDERDYILTHLKSNTILLPSLPSLRTLTLQNLTNIPLRATLASLMPALKTLRLRSLEFVDADPEPGEWWTALELIRGDIPTLVSLCIPRPVRSLTIDVTLENEEAWDPALLVEVLQRASPTCLTIGLQASFRSRSGRPSDPGELHNCSNWLENICRSGAPAFIGVSVYVCASPNEPRDGGTLTAAPLHIRVRHTLSRALPTLRLFGFAVGYRPQMEYEYDFMERDVFSWWNRVEGSKGEDQNYDVGDSDNGGLDELQWQKCFILPGEDGRFMSDY